MLLIAQRLDKSNLPDVLRKVFVIENKFCTTLGCLFTGV